MNKKHLSLFPNSMSLLNLLLGFTSMIYAINGGFRTAVYLIIAAVVVDVLDGIIARKIGVEGRFGLELDSLCDFLSFCVAPSILYYLMYQVPVPLLLLLPITGAVRLARFNVTSQDGYFIGLPSPAAGGLLASITLLPAFNPLHASALLLLTSPLMVSGLTYRKYKSPLKHLRSKPFLVLAASLFLPLLDGRLLFIPFLTYLIFGLRGRGD